MTWLCGCGCCASCLTLYNPFVIRSDARQMRRDVIATAALVALCVPFLLGFAFFLYTDISILINISSTLWIWLLNLCWTLLWTLSWTLSWTLESCLWSWSWTTSHPLLPSPHHSSCHHHNNHHHPLSLLLPSPHPQSAPPPLALLLALIALGAAPACELAALGVSALALANLFGLFTPLAGECECRGECAQLDGSVMPCHVTGNGQALLQLALAGQSLVGLLTLARRCAGRAWRSLSLLLFTAALLHIAAFAFAYRWPALLAPTGLFHRDERFCRLPPQQCSGGAYFFACV